MAINKYQKFLYAIELNDPMLNKRVIQGRNMNPVGWNRETPIATSPYQGITNPNAPSPKVPYSQTGENDNITNGRMTQQCYEVVYGNIVASAARQAAHRRASGR